MEGLAGELAVGACASARDHAETGSNPDREEKCRAGQQRALEKANEESEPVSRFGKWALSDQPPNVCFKGVRQFGQGLMRKGAQEFAQPSIGVAGCFHLMK